MSLNTTLAILYHLKYLYTLELIHSMLILELFVSFAIITCGIIIGRIKNLIIYHLLASLILVGFLFIYIYFKWSYDLVIFTYAKLLFFFVWILISSISLFFLLLYFFTSFPKKVITIGMPKDHVFFGFYLKLVACLSIPFYLYMIFQMDISGLIFGIFGMINALIVLRLIGIAPKKVEKKPGIINFATAIAFYNLFMFYHLIMSFGYTSETAISLILEILGLLINVLYLVQVLTRRISETPEKQSLIAENPIKFQSRIYFTFRLKKVFGESGVVLIVLGIALGYHMVYLDSFFISDNYIGTFPILSTFVNPNLKISDLYHRFYLLISFLTILIASLTFKSSARFRNFMTDKFTIRQVFRYMGEFFTQPESREALIEYGKEIVNKKIGEGIKNWRDRLQKSIDEILREKDEEST
jgi:hypothetical protein